MASYSQTSPLAVPTTIDTAALSMSLADYRKVLVDNVYNTNVILSLCEKAGTKRAINGGMSIVESIIRDKQDEGGFYLGADILNNNQRNTTDLVEFKWQNRCYKWV